jgi:hypothetical protein
VFLADRGGGSLQMEDVTPLTYSCSAVRTSPDTWSPRLEVVLTHWCVSRGVILEHHRHVLAAASVRLASGHPTPAPLHEAMLAKA